MGMYKKETDWDEDEKKNDSNNIDQKRKWLYIVDILICTQPAGPMN